MPRHGWMARRGFTLVELLAALVIAGAVVLAAHQTLGTVTDAAGRSRAARQQVAAQAAARVSLDQWLHGAVLIEDAGSGGELTLWLSSGGPLRPGAHRVRLWIDHDPTTPRGGLVAELVRLRSYGAARPETLEVARQVTAMSCRGLVEIEGRERWMESCRSSGQLPRAIEIRLTAAADADQAPLFGLPVVAALEVARW